MANFRRPLYMADKSTLSSLTRLVFSGNLAYADQRRRIYSPVAATYLGTELLPIVTQ